MSTRDSTLGDPSTPVVDGTPSSTVSATTDNAPLAFQPNILQCCICTEPPTDPISTSCGDVFCWPCMHQWLQNGPKPCPVCGYTLRRDLDIIPLYGGGAPSKTGTSAGTTSTTRETTTSDIDIPPRPRNPLLLTATPTPTPTPTSTPTPDDNSGSENLTSASSALTPSSMSAADDERSIHQLSESLEAEQVRVMRLSIDCIDLELEMSDLEHQHAELRRAVRDRERVLREEREEVVQSGRRVRTLEERNERLAWEAEEGREREKRHIERINQMVELVARLQQRLEVADRQLPLPGVEYVTDPY